MDPPPAAEGLPGDALPTAGDGNEGEKDQPELRTMLELRVTAAGGAGVLDPFPPLAINKFSKSFIHIQLATDLCRCHHRGQGGHGWAPQSYQTFLPREEVIALKSCCPKLCSSTKTRLGTYKVREISSFFFRDRSCASPFEVYSCSNMDDDDAS